MLSVHVITQDVYSMGAEGEWRFRGEGKAMDQKLGLTLRTLLWEKEGEKAGLGPGLRRGWEESHVPAEHGGKAIMWVPGRRPGAAQAMLSSR